MEKTNTIHNNIFIIKLLQYIEMFIFSVLISSQLPLAVNALRTITFASFTPKFVFVITNLIILLLFVISKKDENRDICYYEYVKSYDMSGISSYDNHNMLLVDVASNKRKICRSKSEDPIKTKCREGRVLRRSRTELSRSSGDKAEKLSGEEFRRTVEAFIARQQRMLRDEEFSPMVYIAS